jgi:hypothetical protein
MLKREAPPTSLDSLPGASALIRCPSSWFYRDLAAATVPNVKRTGNAAEFANRAMMTARRGPACKRRCLVHRREN